MIKLKKLGKNTVIFDKAKLIHPEGIEIGNDCKIDDFTFINGKGGVKLKNNIHIASGTKIVGVGGLVMDDHSCCSFDVKIVTSTAEIDGYSASVGSPLSMRKRIEGKVKIGKHAVIFSGAIIMPGVTIGEGAVVGALSYVDRDLEPWTIYVGCPVRKLKMRKKGNLK